MLLAACAVEPENISPRDDAPDGPQPTPAFGIASVQGTIAIEETGIRPEYRVDGRSYTSSLVISLYDDDFLSDSCSVRVPPVFVGFAQRTMSGREFSVVQIDAGQGILGDGCGWDDGYMQAELAALGPIEIGWARPGIAEDWPNLDVSYNVGLEAPIAYRGAGSGYAMDADGNVSAERVNLFTTTLDRGLYEF